MPGLVQPQPPHLVPEGKNFITSFMIPTTQFSKNTLPSNLSGEMKT